jgi:hypothetical protein
LFWPRVKTLLLVNRVSVASRVSTTLEGGTAGGTADRAGRQADRYTGSWYCSYPMHSVHAVPLRSPLVLGVTSASDDATGSHQHSVGDSAQHSEVHTATQD